jgi:hypothetical protein
MKADYEAQEGIAGLGVSAGRNKKRAQAAAKAGMHGAQWRPTSVSALPDRLVAQGRRVETVDIF